MRGIIYALIANGLWGIYPLYWAQLEGVSLKFLLGARIFLSFLVYALVVGKQFPLFMQCFKNKDFVKFSFLCSTAMLSNWLLYIYSMVNQKIVESSLGYFMEPLIVILMGTVLLREPLNLYQKIGTGLVVFALGMITYFEGMPLFSIVLASTFSSYSYFKKIYYKKIKLYKDPNSSEEPPYENTFYFVVAEGLFMLPWAIGIMSWIGITQEPIQATSMQLFLLAFSGIITIVPMWTFGKSAQLLSLSLLGFLQFVAPISQFVIGLYVFKEPLKIYNLYGYILIWIAVILSLIPTKQTEKS